MGLHPAPRTRPEHGASIPGATGPRRFPFSPNSPTPFRRRVCPGPDPGVALCGPARESKATGRASGRGALRPGGQIRARQGAGRTARREGRGPGGVRRVTRTAPRRAQLQERRAPPGASGARGGHPGRPRASGRARRSSPPAYFGEEGGEEGRERRAEPTPGESGDCPLMRPPPSCPRREGSRRPFSPSERAGPRLIPIPTLRDLLRFYRWGN